MFTNNHPQGHIKLSHSLNFFATRVPTVILLHLFGIRLLQLRIYQKSTPKKMKIVNQGRKTQ